MKNTPDSANEMLAEVLGEVLRKQAYMLSEPVEAEKLPLPQGTCVQAGMNFSGFFRGRLTLAVPMEMCTQLVANELGIEPDETNADQAEDALKELLNVTCGRVLTALAGEQPVFDLSLPEVRPLSAEEWRQLAEEQDVACLLVETHPALLRLIRGD